MNKELQVINQFGYELTIDEFEGLKKNHPYIGEKLILDLVNGVGVVAKDLNDASKSKEKGVSRILDSLLGNNKKRQNQINENIIEGLNATSKWLQDHDRHISRVDGRIKDIADELYNTQDQIISFYEQFKGVESIVNSLEVFREVANKRFNKIEKRLNKVEAQQHVDREIEKIGTLNLPILVEVFTVLDNLVSREAGFYYMREEDSYKKEEFLTYIKNKIKSKIGSNNLQDLVDYQQLYKELKLLEPSEQKVITFLGSQYSSFSDDSLYEVSDIVKIISTSKSIELMEEEIGRYSHISTFMLVENLIDANTEELFNLKLFVPTKKQHREYKNNINDDEIDFKKTLDIQDENNLKKTIAEIYNIPNHEKKLGVVLSGGGAKGAYEVGFLKALAEFNIQPAAISGTSIGALNGAIYSAKKDTKVSAKCLEALWNDLATSSVLEIDKETAIKTIIDVVTLFVPASNVTKLGKVLMLSAKGAKSTEGILTQTPLINRLEEHASAKDLKKGLPFHIGLTKSKGHAIDTYNFLGFGNEETVYKKIQNLKEEEIHAAIMASASLPILFNSLEVEGEIYSDGCLSSTDKEWGNTPIKPLIEDERCTHIIICHLNEGSSFNRHDGLFKDIPIIEVRPEAGTFNSALDPLRFKVEKIDIWMEQGYKDSKRILGESFKALKNVEKRKVVERVSDDAVDKLKNRNFKLG